EQADRARLLDVEVRGVVRRHRAGAQPAPGGDGDGGRAARRDLGRRRRGARVRADRAVRPPVPGGAAGRAEGPRARRPLSARRRVLAFAHVQLDALTGALGPVDTVGGGAVEIEDLAYDAGRARPGSLFFCVPGARVDGHDFAAEAVRNGAVGLVVERRVDVAVPQVVVEDVRAAMAIAADVFFGEPTRQLEVAGVTGTNGKTTTAFLLRSILEQAGRRPGLVGTVEWVVGGERRAAPFTTPEAIDLQRLFREMLDA